MSSNKIERLTPFFVFGTSLAVFWWNAAPTVTLHDSGELALAAATAGIPHPPGMPTWTALASTFVRLGGFNDAARGTNLFSGVCAAGALGFLSSLILGWIGRLGFGSSAPARMAGAIAGPLILLGSTAFLEQSFITEQYTLMILLIAALLWIGSCLASAEMNSTPAPSRIGTRGMILLLGWIWGLAIGNHLSQIALGLFVGWVVLLHAARSPQRVRSGMETAGLVVVGLGCGLLIFGWLPLRSAQNPTMDWGYVRSWDNFLFAVMRKQWPTRPITSAPRGYVHEWLVTYDFAGQMGIVGSVLALAGLLLIMKRNKHLLGWLFTLSIPYAAGMLLGHMHEEGKNVGYIRHYGVTDWHLPIYWVGAFAGGIAAANGISWIAQRRGERAGAAAMIVILGFFGSVAMQSLGHASLRNFRAPEEFISKLLAPIPDDGVIAVSGDNAANMLCYDRYGRGNGPKRTAVYALRPLPRRISEILEHGDRWNEAQKITYLCQVMMDPKFQPIRINPITPDQAKDARVFVDYLSAYPEAAPYFLPKGYLYEVQPAAKTLDEIRQAESSNQAEYPELFKGPKQKPHRLEAEAYAVVHQDRGMYFSMLGLYPEAEAALNLSQAWVPDNGEVSYRLGLVQEELGKASEAEESYRRAIANAYFLPNARNSLGVLLAVGGHLEEAIDLFKEELKLFPESAKAKANLERASREQSAVNRKTGAVVKK